MCELILGFLTNLFIICDFNAIVSILMFCFLEFYCLFWYGGNKNKLTEKVPTLLLLLQIFINIVVTLILWIYSAGQKIAQNYL